MRSPERKAGKLFGGHLRELRRERELSQEALAEKSDLSLGLVGRIERAVVVPGLITLLKLAVGLAVPVETLLAPFSPEVVKRLKLVSSHIQPTRRSARGRKLR
jgi:transcriptional regulator with XRE-family HTH domain